MSTQDPRRAPAGPSLTPLPRVEDIPRVGDGFDREKVEEAFDAFRRHVTALQSQLRVLQAAPRSAITEPSGHAVRMDALHLIRSAAEFAETRGNRLMEQSRHQATELTNAARAEVEQTLEWARAQADVIVQRARMGAEQLLSAAGHGEAAVHEAVEAIVRAAEALVPKPSGVTA